jgi:hypothetical protein
VLFPGIIAPGAVSPAFTHALQRPNIVSVPGQYFFQPKDSFAEPHVGDVNGFRFVFSFHVSRNIHPEKEPDMFHRGVTGGGLDYDASPALCFPVVMPWLALRDKYPVSATRPDVRSNGNLLAS